MAPKKSNPRIPRKKGQRAMSKKHSDLYTDENPKGTIKNLDLKMLKQRKQAYEKLKPQVVLTLIRLKLPLLWNKEPVLWARLEQQLSTEDL